MFDYEFKKEQPNGLTPSKTDHRQMTQAVVNRAQYTRPLVGDAVKVGPITSYICNITEDGEGVQMTLGSHFYVDDSGLCTYSGTLYPSIDLALLKATDSLEYADCWKFSDGKGAAHSGLDLRMQVRVWAAPVRYFRLTRVSYSAKGAPTREAVPGIHVGANYKMALEYFRRTSPDYEEPCDMGTYYEVQEVEKPID